MTFQIKDLIREFKIKKDKKEVILKDPNPSMTPEEVAKFYASEYPELTNALIEGPTIKDDKAGYSFTTKAGKLG